MPAVKPSLLAYTVGMGTEACTKQQACRQATSYFLLVNVHACCLLLRLLPLHARRRVATERRPRCARCVACCARCAAMLLRRKRLRAAAGRVRPRLPLLRDGHAQLAVLLLHGIVLPRRLRRRWRRRGGCWPGPLLYLVVLAE